MDSSHKRDIEGMGIPEIKYGDSVCFVQHIASGLWVTYKAQDAKTSRLGPLKRKVRDQKGWKQLGMRSDCGNKVGMMDFYFLASQMAQWQRISLPMQVWVRFLGQEDPLEKEMTTHSSIFASRIPWTEGTGRLQVQGVAKELDTTTKQKFLTILKNYFCDRVCSLVWLL